jgi:hypothetical protein
VRRTLVAVGLVAAVAGAACGGSGDETGPEPTSSGPSATIDPTRYPKDDELRLNQLQALATHNSYHVKPEGDAIESAYTHPPIDDQLEIGVRGVDFDVHLDDDDEFRVFHTSADPRTTCARLDECLRLVRAWSDAHREHSPIFVLVEPKDDDDEQKIEDYDALDEIIVAAFSRERLITPDDVQGNHPNLRDAIEEDGWPTLRAARGKVIALILDNEGHGERYSSGWSTLRDRVMFVDAHNEPGAPVAVFFNFGDPAGDEGRIRSVIADGYLVRTRTDSEGREPADNDSRRMLAALRSGAQLVATDFPRPHPETGYVVAIPSGRPARCNPLTAPPTCSPDDIE